MFADDYQLEIVEEANDSEELVTCSAHDLCNCTPVSVSSVLVSAHHGTYSVVWDFPCREMGVSPYPSSHGHREGNEGVVTLTVSEKGEGTYYSDRERGTASLVHTVKVNGRSEVEDCDSVVVGSDQVIEMEYVASCTDRASGKGCIAVGIVLATLVGYVCGSSGLEI